jgi:hypothetical protein
LLEGMFSKQKMAISMVGGLKYYAHRESTFKNCLSFPCPVSLIP